jgi:hypothetical protein
MAKKAMKRAAGKKQPVSKGMNPKMKRIGVASGKLEKSGAPKATRKAPMPRPTRGPGAGLGQ